MMRIACGGRDRLDDDAAAAVAAAVRGGGLLAYPTDTLYALGADPRSPGAVRRVFLAKGRGQDKPLPVLLAGAELVEGFAAAVPAAAGALLRELWPGPLTVLLPARPGLPPGVVSAAGEVALRVPGTALCRAILAAAGGALTGTSANPSGAGGGEDPDAIAAVLGPQLALLLDAGTLPASRVSTIVRIGAKGGVEVVREGVVAAGLVEAALGRARC